MAYANDKLTFRFDGGEKQKTDFDVNATKNGLKMGPVLSALVDRYNRDKEFRESINKEASK